MNDRWQSPQRTATPDGLDLQASVSADGTRPSRSPADPGAIGEAARRGHVPTNAAEIAKAPRLEGEDIGP
jgi:integrase